METLNDNNDKKKTKIFFEEADRPPPSYYDDSLEKMPLKKIPFQTPDPESWLKAPEFVPRRKKLEEAFASLADYQQDRPSLTEVPYVPFGHRPQMATDKYVGPPPLIPPPTAVPPYMTPPFPPMVSMPPATASAHPMPVIPNGYTVNIRNINQGGGPPIPAIVLRKKRRKRNKHTQSLVMNSSESSSSSHPLDPNGYGSDQHVDTKTQQNPAPIKEDEETADVTKQFLSGVGGGSCPNLSDEQLEIWDNYLYAATVDTKEEKIGKTSPPPKSPKSPKSPRHDLELSVYDVIPRSLRDVAEQQLDGFSNPEIRRLDREINGNQMSSSMVMKRLAEQRYQDSDGSTQRSLAAEMKELTFRPELNKYGYPQVDAPRVQLATLHHNTVRSQIAKRCAISDSDSDQCEEDCFEGMNITVNTFDTCDDLTLSDIEKAPTRFEQIQQALKQNTLRYAELRPPQRVCCTIM